MALEPQGDSTERRPAEAESLFQRAVALRKRGHAVEADAACGEALAVDPRHFPAYHLRGLIALERGDIARGIGLIETSLTINPQQSPAHSNIGNALLSSGQPERALDCFDRALQLNPQAVVAHYNRGNALRELRRLEAALASYDAALALNDRHAQALNNRGLVLVDLGRLAEALDSLERACIVDALFAAAQKNRAMVLLNMNRPRQAFEALEQLEQLAPGDPETLCTRGAVLLLLGRPDEAAESFAAVLRIAPTHAAALENLFQLRMDACVWDDYESWRNLLHASLRRTSRFINPLTLLMFDDDELSLVCARTFIEERYPSRASFGSRVPAVRSDASGKIRIAYVSADFREHPVSHLLVGTLEHHDRRRFEVIGIYLCPAGHGEFDHRIRSAFDDCIDVSDCTDAEAARVMRERGVDIAVDLMGFTEKSRLGVFAHRAAPVQISFLGYAGTTGAPYMDYLLVDQIVVPPERECRYRERLIRLPYCYLPNDDRRRINAAPTRAQAGLPERVLVFCAFTKAHKINPPMFDTWMRLLREAEGSVLWLRDMGIAANENLRREAAARGVDPNRLVFAPRVASNPEHLGRQALADLYLDTLPHNAHSTTCDALWAGVPVLTATGSSFQSRVAASALAAVGLPELITDSLDAYLACAIELARNSEKLQALRLRLQHRRQNAPLFDTTGYTRQLEAAFTLAYDHARLGLAPRAFSVPP